LESERLTDGIVFPEGLAWSADTGTLLAASVQTATVYRIWPQERRRETFGALDRGGANNLTLAADGGVVVCQNGGIDAGPSMARRFPEMGPLPGLETTRPGLVYISPEGESTVLLGEGINAPNDITVAADGALVFTDPGNPFLHPQPRPRLMRWSATAGLSQIADGFDYCNGIFADGESLLITDHGGVLRIAVDGSREWVVEYDDGNVDGLTVDSEGRIYVARQAHGRVDVIDDGAVVERLELPAPAMVTNVCFGGPDGSWLFVADARQGAILVFPDLPARGAPVSLWERKTA
jgi:gluconolactonase